MRLSGFGVAEARDETGWLSARRLMMMILAMIKTSAFKRAPVRKTKNAASLRGEIFFKTRVSRPGLPSTARAVMLASRHTRRSL
jgi:hypothetical protein